MGRMGASKAVRARSRAAGWRIGVHLGTAVPLVLAQCGAPSARDEELREHCLQVRASGLSSAHAYVHVLEDCRCLWLVLWSGPLGLMRRWACRRWTRLCCARRTTRGARCRRCCRWCCSAWRTTPTARTTWTPRTAPAATRRTTSARPAAARHPGLRACAADSGGSVDLVTLHAQCASCAAACGAVLRAAPCGRLTDEEYSDDEDVSWKVRRAAAKCLATIVCAYPDRFADIYARACPALLACFREREESVKIDVFQAFIALLRQVRPPARDRAAAGAAWLHPPGTWLSFERGALRRRAWRRSGRAAAAERQPRSSACAQTCRASRARSRARCARSR